MPSSVDIKCRAFNDGFTSKVLLAPERHIRIKGGKIKTAKCFPKQLPHKRYQINIKNTVRPGKDNSICKK